MGRIFAFILKAIPFAGILLVLAGVALPIVMQRMDANAMGLIFLGFLLFLCIFLRVEPASVRHYATVGLSAGLLLGIFALAYLLIQNHNRQWDLTKNSRYSLSPQTEKIVSTLKKRVDIEVMASSNEPYYGYLRQFSALSSNLKFRITNPYQEMPFRREHEGELRVNDILIRSGQKERKIQFNAKMDIRQLEKEIANGILMVTMNQDMVVYFVSRHGEKSPFAGSSEQAQSQSMLKFAKILSERAYSVDTVDLERDGMVPNDCAILILAGPQTDYSDREIDAMRRYLKQGGALLALMNPPQRQQQHLLRLRSFLSEYGIQVSDQILADYDSYAAQRNVFVPLVAHFNPGHEITENMQGLNERMAMALACPVEPGGYNPMQLSVTPLIRTSDRAWTVPFDTFVSLVADKTKKLQVQSGEQWRSYALGVAASAKAETPSSKGAKGPRLAVYGDADFLSDAQLGNIEATLGYYTISWLSHQDDLLDIPARLVDATPMVISAQQQNLVALFCVAVLPFTILFGGLTYTTIRRRRR